MKYKITDNLHNQRIDKALSLLTGFSRSYIQKLISNKCIKINNEIIENQDLKITQEGIVEIQTLLNEKTDIVPKNIPIDIIYEDKYLMVINKQAGLTVHPGGGNYENTLVNALLYKNTNLSNISGCERPGIVHRLDKDTSGLMIIAKDNQTHYLLSKQLSERTISRKYYALVWNIPVKKEDSIKTFISRSRINRKKMCTNGNKIAITHYKVIKTFSNIASLLECKLETGRTHQIRLHLSHIGNSIIGDQTYGHNDRKIKKYIPLEIQHNIINRQALHAYYIRFTHPISQENIEFTAKIPDDIQNLIDMLIL